jgi:hypothetical protein
LQFQIQNHGKQPEPLAGLALASPSNKKTVLLYHTTTQSNFELVDHPNGNPDTTNKVLPNF